MKTIKVRIAVAVSAAGQWEATGGAGWTDNQAREYVRHGVENCSRSDEAIRVMWVTAEVPLPVDAEIVGEVTE